MPAPTGQRILQLARKHVGEAYVFGAFAPKDNPKWTGPWDCAEFASWLTFQVASTLYVCDRNSGSPSVADAFTGFWQRDAQSLGIVVPLDEASRTPGAFVLRTPAPGAIGHVVLSDGTGGTVEAHSTNRGVIASTLANRRWDMGILIPGITYKGGPAVTIPPPPTTVFRLTTPAMTGPKVREIQRALKKAGFEPGSLDGEFGPHTHAAVMAFQLSRGMLADGEVGARTAKALGIKIE
jgi:hypothetical protein